MSQFMMAYGLASIMLCTGMFLRARILFFQKMLVPASVIGGVIGFSVHEYSGRNRDRCRNKC